VSRPDTPRAPAGAPGASSRKKVAIAFSKPSAGWREQDFDARAVCRKAARAAVALAAPKLSQAELSIVLGDDALVHRLNREWRGQDKPTNVLSFPASDLEECDFEMEPQPGDAPILLGDVVLALETVTAEAAAQHKRAADHLTHLVVHGVLHLLGFDHEDEAEAVAMEGLEIRILAGMGLADPYSPFLPEAAHG